MNLPGEIKRQTLNPPGGKKNDKYNELSRRKEKKTPGPPEAKNKRI